MKYQTKSTTGVIANTKTVLELLRSNESSIRAKFRPNTACPSGEKVCVVGCTSGKYCTGTQKLTCFMEESAVIPLPTPLLDAKYNDHFLKIGVVHVDGRVTHTDRYTLVCTWPDR